MAGLFETTTLLETKCGKLARKIHGQLAKARQRSAVDIFGKLLVGPTS